MLDHKSALPTSSNRPNHLPRSSNYISDRQLGTLLKQWAGEDEVKEEDKGDKEVSKLLTVLNEDLDEEDLQTVLLECLKDAPGAGDDDDKGQAAAKPSLMRRVFCLPRSEREAGVG